MAYLDFQKTQIAVTWMAGELFNVSIDTECLKSCWHSKTKVKTRAKITEREQRKVKCILSKNHQTVTAELN